MPHPPLDAFPALDIASTRAHHARGEQLCEWRDELAGVVGRAWGAPIDDDQAVFLSYKFRGFGYFYPASGTQLIGLRGRGNDSVSGKLDFLCPRCIYPRSKLLMRKGEWACRVCHGLAYRSAREGSLTRLWREKDELSELLKEGRPVLMRCKVYDQNLERLEEVTGLIAGRGRPRANEKLGSLVVEVWRKGTLKEVPEPFAPRGS